MDIPGHAVCWINGKIRDLGEGWAIAINDSGDIVGDSGTGKADDPHASLWTHGYRYDLNDLIPKNSGWVLLQATNISNKGQITGYGTFHGQYHAFLLTPR